MAGPAAAHPHGDLSLDWKNNADPMPPIAMLDQACERVTGALAGAGVICVRQNGAQVHDWLFRHFNPSPDWVSKETLYREAAYFDRRDTPEGEMPVMNDFAETLWFTPPRSDPDNGVWWFDNQAHCAIPVEIAPPAGAGHDHRGNETR